MWRSSACSRWARRRWRRGRRWSPSASACPRAGRRPASGPGPTTGEEADPLGDTGWYYCYVPSFVQNIIVNANAGAVQTEGVVVEAGKAAWITVADDNTAAVSYDAQVDADIPEYVEKITVHAYVPLEWKTVNLWAWLDPDGTNAFDSWPG